MNTITDQIPIEILEMLTNNARVVVFTGAGISVAAGLPTLGGPGSQPLWEYNLIEELLSLEKHLNRKLQLTRWLDQMLIKARAATPTQAHLAIVELSLRIKELIVITQNFDGLHQRESLNLIELHGNITEVRCSSCHHTITIEQTYKQTWQSCCHCGAQWRANLLYFDEPLATDVWQAAERAARNCQLMIVIGSSGQILPGGLLPAIARRSGATLLEINLIPTEITPHCAYTVLGDCEKLVPQLLKKY